MWIPNALIPARHQTPLAASHIYTVLVFLCSEISEPRANNCQEITVPLKAALANMCPSIIHNAHTCTISFFEVKINPWSSNCHHHSLRIQKGFFCCRAWIFFYTKHAQHLILFISQQDKHFVNSRAPLSKPCFDSNLVVVKTYPPENDHRCGKKNAIPRSLSCKHMQQPCYYIYLSFLEGSPAKRWANPWLVGLWFGTIWIGGSMRKKPWEY